MALDGPLAVDEIGSNLTLVDEIGSNLTLVDEIGSNLTLGESHLTGD